MKNILILSLVMLISILVTSDNIPQIYIHGTKSEAVPLLRFFDLTKLKIVLAGGWTTWYPMDPIDSSLLFPTAMTRIVEEGYDGYRYGKTIDGEDAVMCDKNTELMITNYPKSVYNFSYYRQDGGPGIIGSNGRLECMVQKNVKIYVCSDTSAQEIFPEYYMANKGTPNDIYTESINGYDYTVTEIKLFDFTNNSDVECWSENLAVFIDKVLAATGADKVDLICHSMGGVVARAAIKYYGCENKVRKLLTIGTPNHPFGTRFGELLYSLNPTNPEWMKHGEHWEMDVEECGRILFKNIETEETGLYLDLMGYDINIERVATIVGNIGVDLISDDNDGCTGVEQSILDCAEFNAVIDATHSSSEENLEHCECTSTYVTSFIKSWMIDGDSFVFDGEITDYGFGIVGNINNPTSKSIRLIVDGTDEFGNDLKSYEGILCGVVTSIYEHQNITDDVGPTMGIDFTNITNNNRKPGILRGSPIYLKECPWSSNAIFTKYHPKASFYDMNGLIEIPEIEHDYSFNWGDAIAPYVDLLPGVADFALATALSTYTINWISNDISVRNRLWYIRAGSIEMIDSMIPGSAMSKSFRIPPLRSSKTIPSHPSTYNLMQFNVRFELDDNGYFCQDSKWLTVSTPDWNPDNLSLVYQDEDSIKLAWTDTFNLVNRIIRSNDDMQRDVCSLNTYTDTNFIRGMNNNYEVHSRWVYPNGDILISENDNNTHRETVFGIPCNAPKAYPIACIWQPNNKALIKWVDNSNHEDGYRIKIKENDTLKGTKDTIINLAEDPDTLEWIHQTTRTGQMKYIVYSMNKGAFSKDSVEYINYRGYGTPFVSLDSIDLSKGTVRITGDTIITGTRRRLNGDILSVESYKEGVENKILKSEFVKDSNAQ
ncbi:MAG: esterase/lipase family protein, partial [bacterium]